MWGIRTRPRPPGNRGGKNGYKTQTNRVAHKNCYIYGIIFTKLFKGQVCSLAYELAATWRWPTLAQMNNSELSHMAGAVDDSTINIVEVIIIIIIIITTYTLLSWRR